MTTAPHAAAVIDLPAPRTSGGKPLFDCLRERASVREFDSRPLPARLLSDLLWATFGVSRPDGKRTAPTSFDSREFDLYLFTADGIRRYDANAHGLVTIKAGDFRAATGAEDWVVAAPLNLVFVADYLKLKDCPRGLLDFCATADVGFLCENLSLFCASEGLASCVRGGFDGERLRALLDLPAQQRVVMAQTVGFPRS
ncbi:SagB/ThcOx family dehydrogenase [candidate division KSB1 bacterium]|nr:SagB/ThcOx family dehydrogenase [candidate division KSB1 bacterium]